MVKSYSNNKNNDNSQDSGDVEIVNQQNQGLNPAIIRDDDASVSVSRDGVRVKKSGNFVIGSLNIITSPVKSGIKKRHETHYRSSNFHLIADIILGLIVLGLILSFIVIRALPVKVELGIDSRMLDTFATSGEVESFEISYANPSTSNITEANIAVNFPDNFSVMSVSPANIFDEASNTFKIGNLPSGANGTIRVDGLVLGEVGSSQVMTLAFNYIVNNKHANSILNSLIYPIDASAFSFELDLDSRVYKDIPFQGKVVVRNNSELDLEGDTELLLKGGDFKILELSHPEASLNNNVIILPSLGGGEQKEIGFIAVSSSDRSSAAFEMESIINFDGNKIGQGQVSKNINIATPKFKVEADLDKTVLREGEKVVLKISYDNQEDAALENVKFNISTNDSAFRIKSLESHGGDKFDILGSSIVFKEPLTTSMSNDFDLIVLLERKNISLNQEVAVSVDIEYEMSARKINYAIYSNYIKFLSDLQIGSEGLYYSSLGDQLGIGPLPPIIGVPTRYWIFWEVNNLGNELKDLSVSATLPDNVFWTEQKSLIAGKLRYGDITKKVNWSLDEVDAIDGKYKAGFEIEFVPDEEDLGKIVDILTNVSYSAFDTFAGKEISGRLPNINTDIRNDSVASGEGRVIKMNVVR